MRLSMLMFGVWTLAFAGPAKAGNDKVLRGPVPDWAVSTPLMPVPEGASGMVFVRRNDTQIHLTAQGQAEHTSYRFKLLHPNALQLGNFSIAWNPAAGAPTVHAMRVHRGSESIDVLEKASFEILRRENQLEAASLDGLLTAVLRIPDLRVGDELEVALTTTSIDPTLGATVAGLLTLAPDPPSGRFHLGLSWDEGQEPHLKLTPDLSPVVQRRARGIALSLDNPALLAPPKDAPARYAWQRIIEYSDFGDWAAVSRKFAPLFARAGRLDASSPLKDEARRIAAAHARPADRAKAALALVQQQVRYVYVGLNGGNLMPATAEETWRRRYGDCKGKTVLLLALLAELGIAAEPVLVSNAGLDDGLDERLPNPGIFDHVLVRASIDGKANWMDGTLPSVAEPSRDPAMPYRWALPLTDRGNPIQRVEWRPAEKPDQLTLYEIDAREGFDKPARITATTILRGIPALQQQAQLSGLTQAQLLSAWRQQEGDGNWQRIDDAQWRWDREGQASVLMISGKGTVDWEDEGTGGKSLILPGGGFSPPEKRARSAEQNQNAPYYNAPGFDCHVTTVRVPTWTQSFQWSVNSSFDTRIFGRNYYRAFDLRDGAIRMIRGSRVEQQEVDAATAARDNERVAAFDNSMASVTFKPWRDSPPAPAATRVPATYEIDWTADRVPCLAAFAAR